MANLTDSTNLIGTITLSKATGTKVTLDTDNKYLTKDIELTINAPTTTATASGATVSYGEGWITAGSTTVTDSNLIAANIKKDVSIFGVTGTLENSSTVTVTNVLNTTGVTAQITADEVDTLITKNITTNGTYTAASDNADGYSSVVVNTSGAAQGMQTITGTIAGTGTTTLQISCSFAPSLIQINGNLGSDPSLRGIVSLTIIKDTAIYMTKDSSSSSDSTETTRLEPIVGYNENDTSNVHVNYANGILTIDTASNVSGYLFTSDITYSYKLIGAGSSSSSLTEHNIYLEFSDSTNTTIPVQYDNNLIGTMITAYNPVTYNNKTVTSAQLDNVTWYESINIPLNTQLVDYTKVTQGVCIEEDGEEYSNEWSYASDYIEIDPSMTFSYTGYYWYYIGLYNESKSFIRSIYVMNDATVDEDNGNIGHGTLSGNKISNAHYIRICGPEANASSLSLIRTA